MPSEWEIALQNERMAREQARYDAVVNALAAAGSDAESARRDYAYYSSINDHNGMADAQRRIARAESRIVQLESGRDGYEEQQAARANQQQQQQVRQPTVQDVINTMPNLLPEKREWLTKHPELIADGARVQELQGAFWASQRMGLQRGSQQYLDFIADRVGVADTSGLGKEQRDAAHVSGIDEATYLENARKLAALKARGYYTNQG
jgi:hypothetical protein